MPYSAPPDPTSASDTSQAVDGLATHSLRSRVADGTVTLGAWCMIPSALSAEVVARGPVDWVMIDMQHGCMSYETAVEMIRAIDLAGIPSIVRIASNEPGIIGRVLDAGALGILVPMIDSAEDARRAVAACLYPPDGGRSMGPVRALLRDGKGYVAGANQRILVIPMIETVAALEAVEEIAAVPGVGALFLGAYDLSLSMGLPPAENDGDPRFDAAVARVVAAAKAAGLPAAMMASVDKAPLRLAQGFRMISIFTDVYGLSQTLAADAAAARSHAEFRRI